MLKEILTWNQPKAPDWAQVKIQDQRVGGVIRYRRVLFSDSQAGFIYRIEEPSLVAFFDASPR